MTVNVKKVGLFVGLTFLLDWTLAFAYAGLGGKWTPIALGVVATAYMFVPMCVAIVVQKWVYREGVIGPLGVSFRLNWWWLVGWLVFPVVALATLRVGLLFPGVEEMRRDLAKVPVHPILLRLLGGLVAGVTINAVAGFGEELGWRGFLQKELGPIGFWRSSVLIGFIWGIWHAPLVVLAGSNYPDHRWAGVGMMTAWCVLLAPILSYVRLKAKSVIAPAVAHGTLNGTNAVSVMLLAGGSDLTIGVTGLAGFIVLVIVNVGLFVCDRSLSKG